jgi:hypothetical protein
MICLKNSFDECFIRYVQFFKDFSDDKKNSYATTYTKLKPDFSLRWENINSRNDLISGKAALAKIRLFFKEEYNTSLPTVSLVKRLSNTDKRLTKFLINPLFYI